MQTVEEAQKPRQRPVYQFEVPEQLANGVTSVGLVELSADEEIMATKRSRGDTMRLAYELAKQALVEVNGAKVATHDGTVDKAFNDMTPKVRSLVLQAYAEIHAPPEGAAEGFLRSRRLKVG